ncbi:hypothetical protein FKW77_001160 [Venturia effusa]|uniref:Enoyl reductase (ER) domain-containing protein n=1 Tax=Venturia effusa TaxID=50376 RepID=A0A517L0S2_9PEZI|nr:hypothetical protein FKW77_001160 [Venturia effusa]
MMPPTTMEAWTYTSASGGLEKNLTFQTSTRAPAPKPGFVLVQVISASINPVDYKLPELPFGIGQLIISTPSSPGLDFCGRVVTATGDFNEGQKVFGRLDPTQFGSLGQYVLAPLAGCVALPEGVSCDEGAAIGTAAVTAYQCLLKGAEDGELKGKSVFIHGGSGGVGVWGIQIAKTLGAKVTTTCSSKNADMLMSLGADEVIDYTEGHLVEKLEAKGQVFDLIVDNVGLPVELYFAAHRFTKTGAQYVQVGGGMSFASTRAMMSKRLTPRFLGGGERPFTFLMCHNDPKDFAQIAKWVQEKRIKVVFDQIFEYEDVPKAYEKLKTGRAKGKIVVHVTKG